MSLDLLDPGKTALIVIDMQNAFAHEKGTLGISGVNIEPAREAVEPISRLVKGCQKAGVPVLWTLQEHFPAEKDHRRGKKRLPSHTSKRKTVSALARSWDAQLLDELAPLADDPSLIIRKHRFGGFYETRLQIVLEMLGVEALLVTGATANACVETTLREAYLRDYDVVAVTDCIAGVSAEWEKPAQEVWAHYLGILADSSAVLEWIENAGGARNLGLAHLLLKVSNLERSRRFYVEMLGFKVRPDASPLPDGRPLVVMEQGLGLTIGGDGQGQVDHIAFEVRGVAEFAQRVKEAGVPIFRDLGPGAYGLTIYVKDPDGNIIEIFEKNPR